MIDKTAISKAEFASIFQSWNRKVYHYALNKTNSDYIAEETVQRVFIKLWHNLNRKQLDIKVEAQLFCISRTVLLDIVKEERRRQLALAGQPVPETNNPTPLDVYRLKEMQSELHVLIENMPEIRKKVFKLNRLDQLSYKEIAQQLSLSPKTVENHIYLALKTLKKAYAHLFLINLFFFIYTWG